VALGNLKTEAAQDNAMLEPKYRRHWSRKTIAIELLRTMFSALALAWAGIRTLEAVTRGETEFPLKAPFNFPVTTDQVGWFIVALLVWVIFDALFAYMVWVFGKELLEELGR